jgi:glucose-1-phosphate thymidylyltransferase
MEILILAAGYGTRLYPVIKNTPKPLLDIGGRPMIDYVLDKVRDFDGLTRVTVVTNNKFFEHFQKWAADHGNFKAEINVVNDGTNVPEERLGSIGDIAFAIRAGSIDDDLMVVGGDNLFDYDLTDYYRFAAEKKPAVTIGLFDIGDLEEAKQMGVVALDAEHKVVSFEEKPQRPKSTLIAMCLYYFSKPSLKMLSQYIEESEKTDKAGDYIRWLSEKQTVYGYQFEGKWFDIGSLESYREAQQAFAK